MSRRGLRHAVSLTLARAFFGVSLVAAAWTSVAQTPARITRNDVNRFVGQRVEICGRIRSRECSKKREVALLSFDRPGMTPRVSIGFQSALRPLFGDRFEDRFLLSDVCATGRVERIDGYHVVLIERPADLVRLTPAIPPPPPFAPDARTLCDPEVTMPKVAKEVGPRYTRDAMRAKIQGVLWVEAVVQADGTVGPVRVTRSLDAEHGLDQQGVAAVHQWRFKPAVRQGRPVAVIVTIELSFVLK